MLSKAIMDSLRPRMYDRWLGFSDMSVINRKEICKEFVAEAWCMIMSEIRSDEDPSDPIRAGEFVMILKQMGLLVSDNKQPDRFTDEFEISLRNWTYDINQGLSGISIYPSCEYYPMDIAQWIISGITPVTEQPYYFLARVLSAFDSSVPDILKAAREEEYRAMQALKRHGIRVSTIKAVLNELKGEYEEVRYECTGEATRCTIVTDEDASVVTLFTDDTLAVRIDTLKQEVHDILLNPFARTGRYGSLYSLVRD